MVLLGIIGKINLVCGVTGNTSVFGADVSGSNPGGPTSVFLDKNQFRESLSLAFSNFSTGGSQLSEVHGLENR